MRSIYRSRGLITLILRWWINRCITGCKCKVQLFFLKFPKVLQILATVLPSCVESNTQVNGSISEGSGIRYFLRMIEGALVTEEVYEQLQGGLLFFKEEELGISTTWYGRSSIHKFWNFFSEDWSRGWNIFFRWSRWWMKDFVSIPERLFSHNVN